jgi:glycerol 3-phosphatase-1
MSTATEADFSAPPEVLSFDGLLFDFDGTIVDSTDG